MLYNLNENCSKKKKLPTNHRVSIIKSEADPSVYLGCLHR